MKPDEVNPSSQQPVGVEGQVDKQDKLPKGEQNEEEGEGKILQPNSSKAPPATQNTGVMSQGGAKKKGTVTMAKHPSTQHGGVPFLRGSSSLRASADIRPLTAGPRPIPPATARGTTSTATTRRTVAAPSNEARARLKPTASSTRLMIHSTSKTNSTTSAAAKLTRSPGVPAARPPSTTTRTLPATRVVSSAPSGGSTATTQSSTGPTKLASRRDGAAPRTAVVQAPTTTKRTTAHSASSSTTKCTAASSSGARSSPAPKCATTRAAAYPTSATGKAAPPSSRNTSGSRVPPVSQPPPTRTRAPMSAVSVAPKATAVGSAASRGASVRSSVMGPATWSKALPAQDSNSKSIPSKASQVAARQTQGISTRLGQGLPRSAQGCSSSTGTGLKQASKPTQSGPRQKSGKCVAKPSQSPSKGVAPATLASPLPQHVTKKPAPQQQGEVVVVAATAESSTPLNAAGPNDALLPVRSGSIASSGQVGEGAPQGSVGPSSEQAATGKMNTSESEEQEVAAGAAIQDLAVSEESSETIEGGLDLSPSVSVKQAASNLCITGSSAVEIVDGLDLGVGPPASHSSLEATRILERRSEEQLELKDVAHQQSAPIDPGLAVDSGGVPSTSTEQASPLASQLDTELEDEEGISQQVSLSDMSGTQPTEDVDLGEDGGESRPGSSSLWRAGAGSLVAADSEDASYSQQGLLEGTESTDELGADGSLKEPSPGSPDSERVPEIHADEEEEEEDDNHVCYMEVGSEHADGPQRGDDEDEDVEMASEAITESGLESYGNEDDDKDLQDDDLLDNRNNLPWALWAASAAAAAAVATTAEEPLVQPEPSTPTPVAPAAADTVPTFPTTQAFLQPIIGDAAQPEESSSQGLTQAQGCAAPSVVSTTGEEMAETYSPQKHVELAGEHSPRSATSPIPLIQPPALPSALPPSKLSERELSPPVMPALQTVLIPAGSPVSSATEDELSDTEGEMLLEGADRQGPPAHPPSAPLSVLEEGEEPLTPGAMEEGMPAPLSYCQPEGAPPPAHSSPATKEALPLPQSPQEHQSPQPAQETALSCSAQTATVEQIEQRHPVLLSERPRETTSGWQEDQEPPQDGGGVEAFLQLCPAPALNSSSSPCFKPHPFGDAPQTPPTQAYFTTLRDKNDDPLAGWDVVLAMPRPRLRASRTSQTAAAPQSSSPPPPCPTQVRLPAGDLPPRKRQGEAPPVQLRLLREHQRHLEEMERLRMERQQRVRGLGSSGGVGGPNHSQTEGVEEGKEEDEEKKKLQLEAKLIEPSRTGVEVEEGDHEGKREAELKGKKSCSKESELSKAEGETLEKVLEEQRRDLLTLQLQQQQHELQQWQQQHQHKDSELLQKQEAQQRQQIRLWQRELEEQSDPPAPAAQQLSPSSGSALCTIYEALEGEADEQEQEEEASSGQPEPSSHTEQDYSSQNSQLTDHTASPSSPEQDGLGNGQRYDNSSPVNNRLGNGKHRATQEEDEVPLSSELEWGSKAGLVQQLISQTLLLAGQGCEQGRPAFLVGALGGGTLSPLESSLWPQILLPSLTDPPAVATVTAVSSFAPERQQGGSGISPQGEWTVVEVETHH